MQINGIGTTLLGISDQDSENFATATEWFTFIYLPVLPLSRLHVQFMPHTGAGFSYRILGAERPRLSEVLRTYVSGWIGMPLLVLGPLVLAIAEIWQPLGLPESWHPYYIGFAILWLVVAVWKLNDWHENRCRPRRRLPEEPPAPPPQAFP